jgi:hypothetical protein
MVGYDSFTEMAANLEDSARSGDSDAASDHLAQIIRYASQLITPGNDDGDISSATGNAG